MILWWKHKKRLIVSKLGWEANPFIWKWDNDGNDPLMNCKGWTTHKLFRKEEFLKMNKVGSLFYATCKVGLQIVNYFNVYSKIVKYIFIILYYITLYYDINGWMEVFSKTINSHCSCIYFHRFICIKIQNFCSVKNIKNNYLKDIIEKECLQRMSTKQLRKWKEIRKLEKDRNTLQNEYWLHISHFWQSWNFWQSNDNYYSVPSGKNVQLSVDALWRVFVCNCFGIIDDVVSSEYNGN